MTAQIGSTADFADQYTYDNLGRMTGVEQSEQSGQSGGNSVAPKRVDFAYDAASQFDTITRYANLGGTQLVAQSDYDYDNASRLTALSYTKGATTLAGYTWTYDAAGRLTQFVSTADGTANYTYDDTNQLAGATYTYQSTEAYSYDANGNRANTGYSTGDGNRMTSDGTYNYQYDNEGNRTKRTNIATGAVTEYTWDYRDRLTKVTERASAEGAATKVVEYSYDVLNRRVTKDVDSNGDETFETGERYVYDGQQIALQFDRTSALGHRYLSGPVVDQVLADENASGVVSWLLADNEGTIRDVAQYDSGTDQTTVVDHLKYDAFGTITSESNSSAEPHFAYAGRDWDPDVGLYYNRARWYDPKTGRFLSEEPSRFKAGDTNLNRYVWNRPTSLTDPTGGSGGDTPPPMAPAPPTDPSVKSGGANGPGETVGNNPIDRWGSSFTCDGCWFEQPSGANTGGWHEGNPPAGWNVGSGGWVDSSKGKPPKMGSGYAYYLVPWHNSPGDGWGWTAGKAAADVAAMAGAGYLVFWGGTLIGWWGAAEVAADTVEVAGPIEATLVDVEYLLDTVITKITKIGL